MWAKILAGAVAAVAVGGTGTYFAMNGTSHCCPFSGGTTEQQVSADDGCGCCLKAPDSETCPGDSACSSEAMAACAGPAALISTTTKTKSAVGACCSE
jgi:hypothetical protein